MQVYPLKLWCKLLCSGVQTPRNIYYIQIGALYNRFHHQNNNNKKKADFHAPAYEVLSNYTGLILTSHKKVFTLFLSCLQIIVAVK